MKSSLQCLTYNTSPKRNFSRKKQDLLSPLTVLCCIHPYCPLIIKLSLILFFHKDVK